mmetsp:Transcript_106651/g.309230  ORF Transcript_106651/g.309230 Transcript_106651/m.309230 type:complete len:219 (+) Transcript_106651:8643-9299(+)
MLGSCTTSCTGLARSGSCEERRTETGRTASSQPTSKVPSPSSTACARARRRGPIQRQCMRRQRQETRSCSATVRRMKAYLISRSNFQTCALSAATQLPGDAARNAATQDAARRLRVRGHHRDSLDLDLDLDRPSRSSSAYAKRLPRRRLKTVSAGATSPASRRPSRRCATSWTSASPSASRRSSPTSSWPTPEARSLTCLPKRSRPRWFPRPSRCCPA